MSRTFIFLILILLLVAPLVANAIHVPGHEGLVPCGQRIDLVNGVEKVTGTKCKLVDAITMIVGVLNVMMQFAGLMALFYVVDGGFGMATAGVVGGAEAYKASKTKVTRAIVGMIIILIAYTVVNTVIFLFFKGAAGGTTWFKPWQ